ncbi:hypothetical protein [Streptomyces lavendofoliae]|uniref:hypothetical protein n=1 Tax=Streptomyces lavendofoliae TaxID=67314 RepID=UPI00167C076F|nr:hypothetical protein [Streptomyces lavendofoliae]
MSTERTRPAVTGHYDVRRGAAAYAPIVGAFGALSVPATIVLFTTAGTGDTTLVSLAAGLLVVAMIGSLTGSIALAAIGAEVDETANLPAAVMFVAVPVVVSLVSVLSAFAVLAAIHLPTQKTLFAVIAGVGGLAGTYFTSFAVGDSWHPGPQDPGVREEWRRRQWIGSRDDAYRQCAILAAVSSVPPVTGLVLRLLGLHAQPTESSVYALVGAGLALAMAGTFCGVQRTMHPLSGDQRGVRRYEAYGTAFSAGLYTLAVLVLLP